MDHGTELFDIFHKQGGARMMDQQKVFIWEGGKGRIEKAARDSFWALLYFTHATTLLMVLTNRIY